MKFSKRFQALIFMSLILCGILFSCKRTKPEILTFEYTYPDIIFHEGDSASFGSTLAGWTYIDVEKIDNRPFLQFISDKKILSKDVHSMKIKSCKLNLNTPSDSTFNQFDSIYVKVGGYFSYNGTPFFSIYPDEMVAEFFPVPRTGLRSITMRPIDVEVTDQLSTDNDVAFRLKLVSYPSIVLPHYSGTAQLTFTVTGTTH